MGAREYDFEAQPQKMNIKCVSDRVEQIISREDYNKFINCIFSMFCILYIILIVGFCALIYSIFNTN